MRNRHRRQAPMLVLRTPMRVNPTRQLMPSSKRSRTKAVSNRSQEPLEVSRRGRNPALLSLPSGNTPVIKQAFLRVSRAQGLLRFAGFFRFPRPYWVDVFLADNGDSLGYGKARLLRNIGCSQVFGRKRNQKGVSAPCHEVSPGPESGR